MLPSTQTDVFDQMTAPVEHKCPKCKKDQKNQKKPMKKFEEMARAGFSMFFCHGDCSAEYLELKAPGVVRGSGHNNDPGDSNTCRVFRRVVSSL